MVIDTVLYNIVYSIRILNSILITIIYDTGHPHPMGLLVGLIW